jgi:hypothetical protein
MSRLELYQSLIAAGVSVKEALVTVERRGT